MSILNFAPFGSTMGRAGLNTALGIGIVFLMLIIICYIIYLLQFVNRPEKSAPAAPAAPVPAPVAAPETDDLELIAVISAAICAYEQAQGNDVSADSLVVRSIRKVNKSRWQKA